MRLFLAGPRKSVQMNLLGNELLPSNQASAERLCASHLMFSVICGPVPKPVMTKHNLIFENQRNKFQVVWVRILSFIVKIKLNDLWLTQRLLTSPKLKCTFRRMASGDWVSAINSVIMPKLTRFDCSSPGIRRRRLGGMVLDSWPTPWYWFSGPIYRIDITAIGLVNPVSVTFDLIPATWPESELRIPKSFHGALI